MRALNEYDKLYDPNFKKEESIPTIQDYNDSDGDIATIMKNNEKFDGILFMKLGVWEDQVKALKEKIKIEQHSMMEHEWKELKRIFGNEIDFGDFDGDSTVIVEKIKLLRLKKKSSLSVDGFKAHTKHVVEQITPLDSILRDRKQRISIIEGELDGYHRKILFIHQLRDLICQNNTLIDFTQFEFDNDVYRARHAVYKLKNPHDRVTEIFKLSGDSDDEIKERTNNYISSREVEMKRETDEERKLREEKLLENEKLRKERELDGILKEIAEYEAKELEAKKFTQEAIQANQKEFEEKRKREREIQEQIGEFNMDDFNEDDLIQCDEDGCAEDSGDEDIYDSAEEDNSIISYKEGGNPEDLSDGELELVDTISWTSGRGVKSFYKVVDKK